MNLTTKQRIYIIKKLADAITTNMDDSSGFLFLKEYIKEKELFYTKDDNGEIYHIQFVYNDILWVVQSSNNATIFKMYKDLFPEEAKKEFSEKKPPYRLPTDNLVLFFSHSYKDVELVTSVKNILEKNDWIECFVAHKDIELSKKWEQEIKKYLSACHCFVAFISKDFKSSNYCDQEVGFAIQRDIPICSFTLDNTSIYGFIKHLQAKPCKNPEGLANQIEKYILDKQGPLYQIAQPKLRGVIEALKNNFLNSSNTVMAESIFNQLMGFKSGQIENDIINEIQNNWIKTHKIKEVKGIEQKMEQFFKKHQKVISKAKALESPKDAKDSHQKVGDNAQDFAQEAPLEEAELSNTTINLRKILEKKEEPKPKPRPATELPF